MAKSNKLRKKPIVARIISYAVRVWLVICIFFAVFVFGLGDDDAAEALVCGAIPWVIGESVSLVITTVFNRGKKPQNEWVCEQCGRNISLDTPYCPYCGHKKDNEWTCEQCGKKVGFNSPYCPYCGQKKDGGQNETLRCPSCGSPVSAEMVFCEQCGAVLRGQAK